MATLVDSLTMPTGLRPAKKPASESRVWAPLTHGIFVLFLVGSLGGSLAMRMDEIVSVWLMTELSKSPFMISLVTTAFSVPGFVMALPAGALGDMVDRRRLLLLSQSFASTVAAIVAMLTLKGMMGPWVLLASAAISGFLSTLASTTTDAILPQIVPRKDFSAAIALTGVRYHLSRAIGPVIGGWLITVASMGHAFLVCALGPFGMLSFLWAWRNPHQFDEIPKEQMVDALRMGVHYVRHAPQLLAVLVRLVVFVAVGCVMWALLPVYVRHHLGFNALHYGMLFGTFGAGGILGSTAAFRINRSASEESVLGASTIGFALALFMITRMRTVAGLAAVLFFGGMMWSAGMIGLKTAIQMAAPDWIRGRISAIYMVTMHGAVTVGSASWGLIASYWGTPITMRWAGVAMVLTTLFALRFRLASVPAVTEDHPVPKLAPLELPAALVQAGAPVMIALEYRVDQKRAEEFEELMQEIGVIRKRVGATFWGLFADPSVPGKYSEYFLVEHAADARHMHDRMTDPEREVMSRAHSFHTSGPLPELRHHPMVSHHRRRSRPPTIVT